MKKQDLFETEWDLLLVLDACRYDVFEETYNKYFEGRLEKRESKASNTGEWLNKSFKEYYDLTYISANPYVNSFGLNLSECNPKFSYDWKATDHFSKIVDVWFDNWSEELGTVHPRKVNLAFFKNRSDKMILHYLQPHLPYLSKESVGSWKNTIFRVKNQAGKERGFFKKVFRYIRPVFRQKIGRKNYWKMRKLVNLPPRTPFEEAWRKKDDTKLKKHYKKNLEIVLESVSNLLNEVTGKIIITADHGEGLGEESIWGHPYEVDKPFLKTVPWFIIEK